MLTMVTGSSTPSRFIYYNYVVVLNSLWLRLDGLPAIPDTRSSERKSPTEDKTNIAMQIVTVRVGAQHKAHQGAHTSLCKVSFICV